MKHASNAPACWALSCLALAALTSCSLAQSRDSQDESGTGHAVEASAAKIRTAAQPDPALYEGALSWRQVGPFRGGRSAAVTGVRGKPNLYYFGACGGGVWQTKDAGVTWENISDGHFGGSIGAIEVAPSDPNVIYVGGGEVTVRGNVSHGDGLFRSTDAGRTWKFMGLGDSQTIPRIRVHPQNPDLVYVAALGHLYGPSQERGVYRSKDGGKTFERVLFANENAGACDLILDPQNPRIIYASTWRVRRTPWALSSGGEGSALWKSTDGGDTWTELTGNKGMPKGTIGIIGVTVSPANPDRVWAIVEARKGGVFRSEDAGKTWARVNSDRSLRQRAWYYTRIYADTKDVDTVYVCNVGFFRSKDGGKTFGRIRVPHSDNHDLWIDPDDPKRMVEANDGGANVSFDAGRNVVAPGQPADGAVLPRHHRQPLPVPHLRRPAGQLHRAHRLPRPSRQHQPSRLGADRRRRERPPGTSSRGSGDRLRWLLRWLPHASQPPHRRTPHGHGLAGQPVGPRRR
jgi:photosystem II stability/assembly factor-like uncharacterized protein